MSFTTVPVSQYVDLLVKKLDGVAKTDTDVNKSPSNESIASPTLNRGDTCWTQANQIPAIAVATANLVVEHKNTDAIECIADTTCVPIGGIYPTWLTNLTDWIPPEFGATYTVQAYVGPPGAANIVATGTFISSAGQGGTGEWFFDYQAGLLNFIGQTIPSSLTSGNVVYITGYTYDGLTGVTNLPDGTNIGNIVIANTTISSNSANLVAFGGNAGVVMPAGTTGEQPVSPPVGTTRFNTSTNLLESWDGAAWVTGTGGGGGAGSIIDQQILPDGISNTYSLTQATTTAGVFVAINGIQQLPSVAYNVTGNSITFTQTPLTQDLIDVRFVTYYQSVSTLVNSNGSTSVSIEPSGNINLTAGNILSAVINTAGTLDISSGQSIKLPSYTVAQAGNISSPTAGQVIYVSNGDSGAPSLAVYDGSSWKRVALGTTISAT